MQSSTIKIVQIKSNGFDPYTVNADEISIIYPELEDAVRFLQSNIIKITHSAIIGLVIRDALKFPNTVIEYSKDGIDTKLPRALKDIHGKKYFRDDSVVVSRIGILPRNIIFQEYPRTATKVNEFMMVASTDAYRLLSQLAYTNNLRYTSVMSYIGYKEPTTIFTLDDTVPLTKSSPVTMITKQPSPIIVKVLERLELICDYTYELTPLALLYSTETFNIYMYILYKQEDKANALINNIKMRHIRQTENARIRANYISSIALKKSLERIKMFLFGPNKGVLSKVEEQKILAEYEREKLESQNTCDHVEFMASIMNNNKWNRDINQYLVNRQPGKDGWYYCDKCSYRLMCPHTLELLHGKNIDRFIEREECKVCKEDLSTFRMANIVVKIPKSGYNYDIKKIIWGTVANVLKDYKIKSSLMSIINDISSILYTKITYSTDAGELPSSVVIIYLYALFNITKIVPVPSTDSAVISTIMKKHEYYLTKDKFEFNTITELYTLAKKQLIGVKVELRTENDTIRDLISNSIIYEYAKNAAKIAGKLSFEPATTPKAIKNEFDVIMGKNANVSHNVFKYIFMDTKDAVYKSFIKHFIHGDEYQVDKYAQQMRHFVEYESATYFIPNTFIMHKIPLATIYDMNGDKHIWGDNDECKICHIKLQAANKIPDSSILKAISDRNEYNKFFSFYETRCPKEGIHKFENNKCVKCGFDLNWTSNNGKEYYNKYHENFLSISRNKSILKLTSPLDNKMTARVDNIDWEKMDIPFNNMHGFQKTYISSAGTNVSPYSESFTAEHTRMLAMIRYVIVKLLSQESSTSNTHYKCIQKLCIDYKNGSRILLANHDGRILKHTRYYKILLLQTILDIGYDDLYNELINISQTQEEVREVGIEDTDEVDADADDIDNNAIDTLDVVEDAEDM